jgi:hypothetical protein
MINAKEKKLIEDGFDRLYLLVMYEVIIEDENLGTVTVMRSDNLGQCLDKQKRLIQAGHLDCYITRGKA